ncbi:hypothetical protein ANN_03286 [Periplaneta americana]|uniref:Uncharacterized protein n=1 Tax=Periplaneta americana TaxID=6978 RepID=A0ABQ8TYN3_PERAM|nr:hypothetical protein ANN_03286 [Periplaneta americana]
MSHGMESHMPHVSPFHNDRVQATQKPCPTLYYAEVESKFLGSSQKISDVYIAQKHLISRRQICTHDDIAGRKPGKSRKKPQPGAVLLCVMVSQSSGQLSRFREKQKAENSDRFNFFDLELLKEPFAARGEILEHPPYSPDLSPCDLDLIPQMKKPLRGRFANREDILTAFRREVVHTDESHTADGIQRLHHRLQRCMEALGDYFEGC